MSESTPPSETSGVPRHRRATLHVPLPAVLVGLGLVSGPVAAQPITVITRPDGYSIPLGTPTLLPVLANDTISNVIPFQFFGITKTVGNLVAQQAGLFYTPRPGFTGDDSFAYCVRVGSFANSCTTVSLLVLGPTVPVPALSTAALAGLSGVLGWLGVRGRRRR